MASPAEASNFRKAVVRESIRVSVSFAIKCCGSLCRTARYEEEGGLAGNHVTGCLLPGSSSEPVTATSAA